MAGGFDPDAYLAEKEAGGADAFDPDAYLAEKGAHGPTQTEALASGVTQGASFGFADELAGAYAKYAPTALGGFGEGVKLGPGASDELRKQMEAQPTTYELARDAVRKGDDESRQAFPKTHFAGELLGGMAVPIPGAAMKTAGRAALTGAAMSGVSGLGHSEADLTKGEYGHALVDTGLGTVLGGGLGAAGYGVGKLIDKGVGAARNAIATKADEKLAEAAERARAMSAEKVDANIGTLRGKAGGEVQKASRQAENIRRIPGSDEAPDPTAAAQLFRREAVAARQRALQIADRVKASGMEDVADGAGALVTADAKAGRALKARDEIQKLLDYARQAESTADEFERGFATPLGEEGIEAARQAALNSPELNAVENMVLKHNLEQLPDQVAVAGAARGAYQQAVADRGSDIDRGAQDLLSGKAAAQAAKARLLRYGPPVVASIAGSAFGGPVGFAVGGLAGYGAGHGLEALAGAGMRPAMRSIINLFTKYPAVQNAAWKAVRSTANGAASAVEHGMLGLPGGSAAALNPERVLEILGPHARTLVSAYNSGGDDEVAVTNHVLSQTDPDYQERARRLHAEADAPHSQ